jgi:O-antigen ligase
LYVGFLAEPSFLASRTLPEIAIVLGIALLGIAAIVYLSFRLPARFLLGGALALGVLQFFGPFGFTSLGLLATAALLPGAIWRFARRERGVWFWLLAALAAWQTVSVLWAEKVGSAAYGVLLSVALLATFLLARATLRDSPRGVLTSLTIAAPFVLLQAMLVTLFRFFPDVELWYLVSPAARVLSEPGVETIAAGGFANVLDPFKSGGLLLNSNTASLLLALAACLYAWAALQRPGTRLLVLYLAVAAISLDASFGTGSKTPIALALVLPLVGVLFILAVRRPVVAAITCGAGLLAVAGAVIAIAIVSPRLLDEATRTLGERGKLWRLTLGAVPEHWFTGLGFGNWRLYIAENWRVTFPGRGPQPFPPHNLFLQAWVDAGAIALLLTIALSFIPICAVLRRMWRRRGEKLFTLGTLELVVVFVGVTWVVGHGMADTTTFLGDNHTIPFFAVLVALALSPRLGEGRRREAADGIVRPEHAGRGGALRATTPSARQT